ncbi:hypothetical protein [Gillisia sp. CAL575]|uniref:hypothetical protein n=1 Tax=Gillisia sp. CAL575 TaxID=985255 RepID=UPI0003A80D52|nr:hypothetical protein [Gillisia sp. CAL575]
MFNNRVEITLKSTLGTLVLENDPIGYDQSETEVGRSEKTFGIFLTETNNLEFTGESKAWLERLYILKGPNAKCQLIRKVKHSTTDEWLIRADGFLDFSSRKIKNNKLQLDFTEGGLREIFTSQMRERFDLNRLTDINGNTIPKLEKDILTLTGRDIYLLSSWRSEGLKEFSLHSGEWNSGGDNREAFRPAPSTLIANSDPLNISETQNVTREERRSSLSVSQMFYLFADRDHGKVKMPINLSFKISDTSQRLVDYANIRVTVRRFLKVSEDEKLVFQDEQVLINIGDPRNYELQTFTYKGTVELDIKQNESYAIMFYLDGSYGNGFEQGYLEVFFSEYSFTQDLQEDSFFKRTNSNCLTAFEVGHRLGEIYTGEGSFESDLLKAVDKSLLNNDNHQLVFSPGGWIRNLRKIDENGLDIPFPFEISFEDFYNSINAITPVGYGIASLGKKQNIILEDIEYFFQKTVAVNLGKIQITERTTAVEFCYQSLAFGYTKGGDYEQPLGLDEYNTQTNYRTPITISDSEYSVLSPSRADSYGAEDARRKQAEDGSDEDSPYDKDNFMFDVKFLERSNLANYYDVRLYQDDFETLPTGIYSPATAYNLNLSPGRNRQRHEKMFDSSFIMLQDELVQHVNTKGNSELKTKKVGEDALKENDEIPISKLTNPIFNPEWIQAEAPFEQQIMDQVLGSTLINGKMVNNYYCLAEFINENNNTEYAYIFTVKSKDKLTYKLLSAYGI